jgi:hypothetical protein
MLSFAGLGHSHVVALARGAYALQAQGAGIAGAPISGRFHYLYDAPYDPPFTAASRGQELNDAILDACRDGEPRFLLLSIGGNEHNVLSMAQPARRYDFILGENPDLPLDQSGEIIPESAVRETLRAWMSDKTAVLRAIRKVSEAPMIQIEPPPPLPREQVLAYPKEFFRSILEQRKLSSDLLRYKMWRVQAKLMRDLCDEADVLYVETLPDMIDEAGMLAKKAWGKDATHANEFYGEAMVAEALRRLSDILEGKR